MISQHDTTIIRVPTSNTNWLSGWWWWLDSLLDCGEKSEKNLAWARIRSSLHSKAWYLFQYVYQYNVTYTNTHGRTYTHSHIHVHLRVWRRCAHTHIHITLQVQAHTSTHRRHTDTHTRVPNKRTRFHAWFTACLWISNVRILHSSLAGLRLVWYSYYHTIAMCHHRRLYIEEWRPAQNPVQKETTNLLLHSILTIK